MRRKDEGNIVSKYVKSFFHACSGFIYSIRYEHNMIIMLIATLVVTLAGFYYQIATYEWLFILFAVGSVIGAELINSSIEATIDLVTTKTHPLAKIAKDTASAASLVLCTVSFIGACIIFIPKMIS